MFSQSIKLLLYQMRKWVVALVAIQSIILSAWFTRRMDVLNYSSMYTKKDIFTLTEFKGWE